MLGLRKMSAEESVNRIVALGAAVVLVASAPPAAAQDSYPNRPVRIVAGFAAGSSTDIMARLMGSKMGQALGQQFIVENRPGAGSAIAAEQVARGPKDGYTIMIGGSANLSTQIVSPSQ